MARSTEIICSTWNGAGCRLLPEGRPTKGLWIASQYIAPTRSPLNPVVGASIHVGRRYQPLLARPGEVHPHAGAARAAKLPAGRVQLRRLSEVGRLCRFDAIGEGQGLRPSAWKAEPYLPSGLQVE